MKKILCLGLVLAMLCVLLTFTSVSAATIVENGSCGAQGDNVKWTLDSDGTLTISGTGDMHNYYRENDDTPWFFSGENIHKVIIEYGVTSIGDYAFGERARSWGEGEYPNLTNVTIANSVKTIGRDAFSGHTSITAINIPNSVISIGVGAFSDCTKLKTVNMGNSVETIDHRAFLNCSELTTLSIPASVTYIGQNICEYCGKVNYEVSPQNEYYSSQNGVLFNKDQTELISYAKDKIQSNYNIPYGVKYIDNFAFCGCEQLSNITIPDSVISIGAWSFDGTGLYEIDNRTGNELYEGDVFYIDNYLIDFKDDLIGAVTVQDGTIAIAGAAFRYNEISTLYLPKSLKNIGENNFDYCPALTDIYYAGSKNDWEKVVMENYNDYLYNATVHCLDGTVAHMPYLDLSTWGTWDDSTIEITLCNIEGTDNVVVLAVYKRDGTFRFMRSKPAAETVTFENIDLRNSRIKAMLWNNLKDMKPLANSAEMSL